MEQIQHEHIYVKGRNEFYCYSCPTKAGEDKTEMQHFMNCRLGDSCTRCQRFTKGFNQ